MEIVTIVYVYGSTGSLFLNSQVEQLMFDRSFFLLSTVHFYKIRNVDQPLDHFLYLPCFAQLPFSISYPTSRCNPVDDSPLVLFSS